MFINSLNNKKIYIIDSNFTNNYVKNAYGGVVYIGYNFFLFNIINKKFFQLSAITM